MVAAGHPLFLKGPRATLDNELSCTVGNIQDKSRMYVVKILYQLAQMYFINLEFMARNLFLETHVRIGYYMSI